MHDRTAWFLREVLVHEPALRAYLRRLTREGPDVEDLLQETYAHLLALPEESRRNIRTLRGFLFRSARNAAFDRARHRRIVSLRPLTETEASDVVDEEPGAEQMLETHQELQRLAEVIGTLPTRCRQVLTLRKIYGLSLKQIAVQLGIAEHTVEKHVGTGMRLCAERLYAQSEGAEAGKPSGGARGIFAVYPGRGGKS